MTIFFFLTILLHPKSTLFPYTTLFRSRNPNSEIRNKFKKRTRRKGQTGRAFVWPFCLFEFSELFRISDFGFRISPRARHTHDATHCKKMLLTPILLIPAAAGLASLVIGPRRPAPGLGILAFAATLGLGVRLFQEVLARGGAVEEWNHFLYADALS